MACRYTRFFMSDSSTHFSRPTWMSSSSCAPFRMWGWFSNRESVHVIVTAVLSEPVHMRTYEDQIFYVSIVKKNAKHKK
ncbi:hypothetical protein Hanom_Chr08g00748901 [Helianthus anomalus]